MEEHMLLLFHPLKLMFLPLGFSFLPMHGIGSSTWSLELKEVAVSPTEGCF
jgi:hypothetical protein